jgi:hypothetical protein
VPSSSPRVGHIRSRSHVIPGFDRANLVYGLEMLGQVLAIAELEQRGMPIGCHEHITTGIVQAIDLHVARVARVADIDRVEQDDRRQIAARHRLVQAALAIAT